MGNSIKGRRPEHADTDENAESISLRIVVEVEIPADPEETVSDRARDASVAALKEAAHVVAGAFFLPQEDGSLRLYAPSGKIPNA